ncbi:MAG: DMT family transporter [Acidimicrobiales bacterium]|uniref:DMT family transporter n=1 Tax=uncultured Ilumatobacter sp. TaxID=879968 RepID=UPI00374F1C58
MSSTEARAKSIGFLAVGLAVVSFSISSAAIKWSESIGSVVAFWRMIGAVVGWWVIVLIARKRTGRPLPSRETWKLVLPPGLFFGLNIAIFFTAITRTSIAHAEFITTLTPLVLLPAGAAFFGERPNWGALKFGLISVVGIALVLAFGPTGGAATPGGDLLMVLVIGTWTGYMLTSKRARSRGVDVLDFMACMMPLGLITAGPIAASIAGAGLFTLSARGWFVVALLTLVTGMLAHGCIIYAQRHLPVATISIIQTGQPALSVFWGFVILGESVRSPQIVGMVLVVVGLSMFTWVSQRPTAATPTSGVTPADIAQPGSTR